MFSRKYIIAIDSFKGCITSLEANDAAAMGVARKNKDAEIIKNPVSDGGEGWIEAMVAAIGGKIVDVNVFDPLMRPIQSQYAVRGATAYIETAKASGIALLAFDELNPLETSTYGTGQTIAHAIKNGCNNIVVGLGGSATNDCGVGMLKALTDAFHVPDITGLPDSQLLKNINFTIATDVENPLCGLGGAAHVFAPQKGATPEMVTVLESNAKKFADEMALRFGRDCSRQPGAGAAGGLGYAFMQFFGATCRSGAELLLDAAEFDRKIVDASLIITGEGSADSQTLMGKLPSVILRRAKKIDVPVALLAGKVADRTKLLASGFKYVECINPPGISMDEALKKEVAVSNLRQTVENVVSRG